MSQEFFDQLQQTVTPWLMHYWPSDIEVQQGAGWHFCFANLPITPAQKNRFYSFGELTDSVEKPAHVISQGEYEEHYYPSTEQFYGGNGQTQHPIQSIVSASSAEARGSASVILCDSAGRLWVRCGATDNNGTAHNHLGLGPYVGHMLVDDLFSRKRKNARCALTPVFGEDNDLHGVAFINVDAVSWGSGSADAVCSAIDSGGDIWFAGNPCNRSFATEAQFPNDSAGALPYFRKAEFYSYIDASGTVTLNDPIRFHKHAACRTFILALDIDGNVYIWGTSFLLGKSRSSTTPHKVSGFVDGVTITNQGTGYSNFFGVTVTASNPDLADGVRATFDATVSGNKLTAVRINNPGHGYLSAPTLTVTSNGGGGSGATCTAELFDGTWSQIACQKRTVVGADQYACITTSGDLYVCGTDSLDNRPGAAGPDAALSPRKPANHDAAGYSAVGLHADGGIVLTQSGSLQSWGYGSNYPHITSTLDAQYELTAIASANTYTAICTTRLSAAALSDDGSVFTYGDRQFSGRGYFSTSRVAFGEVPGGAVWTAIYGGEMGVILNRHESFDQYGNRIDPIPPGLT